MKIAWFTPFHMKSAIGQVSKLICEELQKTLHVDIWTFNRDNVIETSVSVEYFDSSSLNLGRLQKYDHVIYNMGNYAGNHKQIWDVMQRQMGILLLHDQIMQNFFVELSYLREYGGDILSGEKTYLKMMRDCYGERGAAAGAAWYKAYYGEDKVRMWESDAVVAYPLFEATLNKATAVFTHGSFFMEKLKEHFYGPMGYAYLPHVPSSVKEDSSLPDEFLNQKKVLIVTNGIVHPIKRIERVSEMLLANPEIAQKVQYVIIGEYGGSYGEYLKSLADGPLHGCLYLLGYQPDAIMEMFLKRADFCINLRYPNSEVCSKALIEQMAFGKTVIVLNSGIYGEMPNDTVFKINLDNEMVELENAFRSLIDNKALRQEIGNQAANFVRKNCTTQEYVKRLKDFLAGIDSTILGNRVVNNLLHINRLALKDLAFDQQNTPGVFYTTWSQLSKVCNAIDLQPQNDKVLGIWVGFPYRLSLRREGIIKFLHYMLMGMLERYPIKAEIWTYSFNEEEVRASFDAILSEKEYMGRVDVVTEKNFKEILKVPSYQSQVPWDVDEKQDGLAELAREFSRASCFITAIIYLDNVIRTGKPLFVPVHDLGIHAHYDDFVAEDPLYKARFVDIRSRAENLARSGAFMFSNSEFVRQNHVLKHVSSITTDRTAVIHLPVNVPKHIKKNLLSENKVREKFQLNKPYIFYPTQVRPYKNVTVLVRALSILKHMGLDIELVLTGNPADVPEVEMEISRLQIKESIVCLLTLAEHELFSLYRHAAVAAVPTMFEGGFPWQACEALFMDTPLVLSKIPVVQERIESTGLSLENCGLLLFDPEDPAQCAAEIAKAISKREDTLLSQKVFKSRLLSYSWFDAVEKYYDIFFANHPLPNH